MVSTNLAIELDLFGEILDLAEFPSDIQFFHFGQNLQFALMAHPSMSHLKVDNMMVV